MEFLLSKRPSSEHLPRDQLHVGVVGARETRDGENLMIEVPIGESVLSPITEVVLHVDRSRGALSLSDRKVLGERWLSRLTLKPARYLCD